MIFDVKPTIVGDRGFGSGQRGGFRENTVSSFLAAAACGLKWPELVGLGAAVGRLGRMRE